MMVFQRAFWVLTFASAIIALAGCEHTSPGTTVTPEGAKPTKVASSVVATTANSTQTSAPKQAEQKAAAPASAADLPPGPPKTITFDDLKFDMDKTKQTFSRNLLTPKVESLVGKKIKLRGFILPTATETVQDFVLVRDNQQCCFGGNAALYDCVVVHMLPGKSARYQYGVVQAEGLLTLEEIKGPGGKHLAIYRLDSTDVE